MSIGLVTGFTLHKQYIKLIGQNFSELFIFVYRITQPLGPWAALPDSSLMGFYIESWCVDRCKTRPNCNLLDWGSSVVTQVSK